jgi:hypothetical protein
MEGVAGVGPCFATRRPWRDASVQDALEGMEVLRVCHDDVLGSVERVICTMSVSTGSSAQAPRQGLAARLGKLGGVLTYLGLTHALPFY